MRLSKMCMSLYWWQDAFQVENVSLLVIQLTYLAKKVLGWDLGTTCSPCIRCSGGGFDPEAFLLSIGILV